MKLNIDLRLYTFTAVLTAIKKQQVFANWKVEERSEQTAVLSFSNVQRNGCSTEDCRDRFLGQLNDELLREKLESDFRLVREKLVDLALSPIIKA